MVDQPTGILDEFGQLRAKRTQLQVDGLKVRAALEQSADKVFKIIVDGQPFRYTRFTKEQTDLVYSLPFVDKLLAPHPTFTPEEESQYLKLKLDLILLAVVDKQVWKDKLDLSNPKLVDRLYSVIALASGMGKAFEDGLNEFFDSDIGFNYGYFWFYVQGRTPSEIGKLPDMDVKACNIWLRKYGEKLKPR